MDDNTHIYIDGPINAFRLEGKIDGIHKMIYLFADEHYNLQQQTKCNTYDSIPIYNYIHKRCKELDKLNVSYDLFGEMDVSEFNNPSINSQLNERYIDNYMTMLRTMKYQKIEEGMFKNIRIHYADPRDYLFYDQMYVMDNQLNKMQDRCVCSKCTQDISHTIEYIDQIIRIHQSIVLMIRTKHISKYIANIQKTLNSMMTDKDNLNNNAQNINLIKRVSIQNVSVDDTAHMDQFIGEYIDNLIRKKDEKTLKKILSTLLFFDKLLNKFNNQNVKNLIVDKLSFYYLDKSNEVLECIKLVNNKLNLTIQGVVNHSENKKILYAEFETEFDNLYDKIIFLYSIIMDIYFVKRFIDKEYIERGIMYCGSMHVTRIIYYLVHYLGFSITHIAKNNNIDQINEFNKKIKNNKFEFIHDIYNLLFDENTVQCIDLFNFPENFG